MFVYQRVCIYIYPITIARIMIESCRQNVLGLTSHGWWPSWSWRSGSCGTATVSGCYSKKEHGIFHAVSPEIPFCDSIAICNCLQLRSWNVQTFVDFSFVGPLFQRSSHHLAGSHSSIIPVGRIPLRTWDADITWYHALQRCRFYKHPPRLSSSILG